MWTHISAKNALRRMRGGGSRTISTEVLSTQIDVESLTDANIDHWCGALSEHALSAGDIVNTGYANPNFCTAQHVAALRQVMSEWGVPYGTEEPVTLACLGAGFHHDAADYPNFGFCVLWLTPDCGWDLYFPSIGKRIELRHGTVVLFDSALPHGVVIRGQEHYDPDAFAEASIAMLISQDFPMHRVARRRLGVEKLSRYGRKGWWVLGQDGLHEDLDLETGSWAVRRLDERRG